MTAEHVSTEHVTTDETLRSRLLGVVKDWSSDQRSFKTASWGKAMMWIFLLSDTLIFSCFLTAYMHVRLATLTDWPNPSIVFGLHLFGKEVPLLLIAIMTFVLITSSGTMALAVNYGYRRDKKNTVRLLVATALLGATFVSMQAFEWTKLIMEGVRPWGNPWGAEQFGSAFFMKWADWIENSGLYWHFVDLVWVFIFAFFYLW